jgi:hypothetical protein
MMEVSGHRGPVGHPLQGYSESVQVEREVGEVLGRETGGSQLLLVKCSSHMMEVSCEAQ